MDRKITTMKEINSIGYCVTIIELGVLFLIVILLFLYVLSEVLSTNVYLYLCMKISIVSGALILLCFIIILFIELKQDIVKKI
jgi:hypothetical protein